MSNPSTKSTRLGIFLASHPFAHLPVCSKLPAHFMLAPARQGVRFPSAPCLLCV